MSFLEDILLNKKERKIVCGLVCALCILYLFFMVVGVL
jgi:hypothetical protein